MRLAVVTGPTNATQNEYTGTPIPAFVSQVNDHIAFLESEGAINIVLDCKPANSPGWHACYITYEIPELATVAVALPKTLTIQQVADHLNVSRWYVSDRIRRGELRAINLGKRKVIPFEEYTRFASPS